jgi:hypothetical protein
MECGSLSASAPASGGTVRQGEAPAAGPFMRGEPASLSLGPFMRGRPASLSLGPSMRGELASIRLRIEMGVQELKMPASEPMVARNAATFIPKIMNEPLALGTKSFPTLGNLNPSPAAAPSAP